MQGSDIKDLIDNLDEDMVQFKKIISENNYSTKIKQDIQNDTITQISDNNEEQQYLNLIKDILVNGIDKLDRTGIGTKSIFGAKLVFDLSKSFPLFTTKKMWLKGVFYELKWILSGSTDTKDLQKNKVKIWNGNSTREFLDSRNLHHYEEGDIGPTYGFALRSFGTEYKGCSENYLGLGFDQLEYVINLIKNDPSNRRILVNLWDHTVIDQVALTPCLMTYNFYVDTQNKKLNLQAYIRSSDTILGLPWNISYLALLVNLICNLEDINLTPGLLNIVTCDQHIYNNHIEQASEICRRNPYPFPTLVIKNKHKDIHNFEWDDIEVTNYNFHNSVPAPMAV